MFDGRNKSLVIREPSKHESISEDGLDESIPMQPLPSLALITASASSSSAPSQYHPYTDSVHDDVGRGDSYSFPTWMGLRLLEDTIPGTGTFQGHLVLSP